MPEIKQQTLREITSLALEIEQKLIENDGILSIEDEEALKISDQNISNKIDGYALVISKIEASIEHHKERMKEHAAYIGRLETSLEWMEGSLKNTAHSLNKKILNGSEYSVKIVQNKPKVDITDESKIGPEYFETKIAKVLSKTKIKEALDIGIEIEGARLIQTDRISIGLKKKNIEE